MVRGPRPRPITQPHASTPHPAAQGQNSLAAALCLIFKLRSSTRAGSGRAEAHDYRTKENCSCRIRDDDRTMVDTRGLLSSMRKKLAVHNIRITTIDAGEVG